MAIAHLIYTNMSSNRIEYFIDNGVLKERSIKERSISAKALGNLILPKESYFPVVIGRRFTSEQGHDVMFSAVINEQGHDIIESPLKRGESVNITYIFRSDTLPINTRYVPMDINMNKAIPIFYKRFVEDKPEYKKMLANNLVKSAVVQYKIPEVNWYWIVRVPAVKVFESTGEYVTHSRPILVMSITKKEESWSELYLPPISNVSTSGEYCVSMNGPEIQFSGSSGDEIYDSLMDVVCSNEHGNDWCDNVNLSSTKMFFPIDACTFKSCADPLPPSPILSSKDHLFVYSAPTGRKVIENSSLWSREKGALV